MKGIISLLPLKRIFYLSMERALLIKHSLPNDRSAFQFFFHNLFLEIKDILCN